MKKFIISTLSALFVAVLPVSAFELYENTYNSKSWVVNAYTGGYDDVVDVNAFCEAHLRTDPSFQIRYTAQFGWYIVHQTEWLEDFADVWDDKTVHGVLHFSEWPNRVDIKFDFEIAENGLLYFKFPVDMIPNFSYSGSIATALTFHDTNYSLLMEFPLGKSAVNLPRILGECAIANRI